jgi:hypothetical protein
MAERRTGTGTHGPVRERRTATGKPRRVVFRTWVVVTAVMMAGALALGRLVSDDRIGFVLTGVIFPILTAILLFLGLAWLVRIVFPRDRDRER